jgi:hypothetical protein
MTGERKMYITFLLPNVLIAAFIASFLLSGCGKSDSNDPAQAATGPPRPVQTAKADKKLQSYRRVKKTYKGQTVYQYEMDDFPLQGVPLAALQKDAEAGDPASEYEFGPSDLGSDLDKPLVYNKKFKK